MPIALYPFRYRDPTTGRWVRARYKATRDEIAARHAQWEIIGAVELRGDGPVRMFNPTFKLVTHAELVPLTEPAPDPQPSLGDVERFLVCLFLRRYVSWCARRRRFARMEGAARLYRQLCAGAPQRNG